MSFLILIFLITLSHLEPDLTLLLNNFVCYLLSYFKVFVLSSNGNLWLLLWCSVISVGPAIARSFASVPPAYLSHRFLVVVFFNPFHELRLINKALLVHEIVSIYTPLFEVKLAVVENHMLPEFYLSGSITATNRATPRFGYDIFTFVEVGSLRNSIRNEVKMHYLMPFS